MGKIDKQKITVAWGRAKTEYIRKTMARGRTKVQAEENWKQQRKLLKDKNINFPPKELWQLAQSPVKKQTMPTGEKDDSNAWMTEELDRIERQEKMMRNLQDRMKAYKGADDNFADAAYDALHGLLTPTKGGPAQTSTPKGAGPVESPEHRKVRYNLDSEIDETVVLDQEDNSYIDDSVNLLSSFEEDSDGDSTMTSKRPATGDGGAGPSKFQATEPGPSQQSDTLNSTPIDVMDTSAVEAGGQTTGGGDIATTPGLNETKNRGGGGGGLSGAGNNQFFHKWGGITIERDPESFTYVDTYKRTYEIFTQMPTLTTQERGSIIMDDSQQTKDGTDAGKKGFPVNYLEARWNHGGLTVPYWYREASMHNHDWNKDANHLAYELVEVGWDMPNATLNIYNNDRDNTTEVSPAPPGNARMWQFLDLDQDYGIPGVQNIGPHNEKFTLEDYVDADVSKYQLPQLGQRTLPLSHGHATAILSNQGWTLNDATRAWVHPSPNAVYNMKQKKGYQEFILSEAKLGMSYKPAPVTVRLPHTPQATVDFNARQQYTTSVDMTKNEPALTIWPLWNDQLILENGVENDRVVDDALLSYYNSALGPAYSQQIRDNLTFDQGRQNVINSVGDQQVRPQGNAAVSAEAALATVRDVSHWRRTDDGTVFQNHICKRPPVFCFGVYKQIEYRSVSQALWKYFLSGQITYWSKIRWHVQPMRVHPHMNIGLGGVWTSIHVSDLTTVLQNRQTMLNSRAMYRETSKPILKSTCIEKPQNAPGDNNLVVL